MTNLLRPQGGRLKPDSASDGAISQWARMLALQRLGRQDHIRGSALKAPLHISPGQCSGSGIFYIEGLSFRPCSCETGNPIWSALKWEKLSSLSSFWLKVVM